MGENGYKDEGRGLAENGILHRLEVFFELWVERGKKMKVVVSSERDSKDFSHRQEVFLEL